MYNNELMFQIKTEKDTEFLRLLKTYELSFVLSFLR